jgi:peptide deformylase
MITEITEEQGSGLTATQILLSDGNEIEISVTDDRAVSWPQPGTPLVLINPQPNGVNGTTETFQTINNNYTVARKVTGQRVLHCKHYVLIVPVQM